MLESMKFLTLGHDEWVVKVDPLNKTIEWRDSEIVKKISDSRRKIIEDVVSKQYTECKWLRPFKAITKDKIPSPIIWATGEAAAKDIFQQMNVAYVKLQEVRG